MMAAFPRLYIALGGALLLAAAVAWFVRIDHLRGEWKAKYETLVGEAGTVLAATRIAADNPDLGWDTTAGQIIALGEDRRMLLSAIEEQNATVDAMAREAVRLRAHAAELQRIADRAQAQRRAALRQLSDMETTPGSREDCMTLLREAEQALDIVYEAGL